MKHLLSFFAGTVLLSLQAGAAAQQPLPAVSATIFATVGQSEWCPPGTVFIDVLSGHYVLMPAERRTCQLPGDRRALTEGTVSADQLRSIREAQLAAQSEGLELDPCPRGRIVVSNGGPQVLIVTSREQTFVAPEQLGCWTPAANRLHDVLSEIFSPPSAWRPG